MRVRLPPSAVSVDSMSWRLNALTASWNPGGGLGSGAIDGGGVTAGGLGAATRLGAGRDGAGRATNAAARSAVKTERADGGVTGRRGSAAGPGDGARRDSADEVAIFMAPAYRK